MEETTTTNRVGNPVRATDHMVYAAMINDMSDYIHELNVNAGWWTSIHTGERIDPNAPNVVPAKMMLVVSEMAEAMEGYRKSLMDDHLPTRPMVEVELADTFIRIFDLAGALGLDLGGAIIDKIKYNKERQDHKLESRVAAGGKAF